MRRMTVAQTTDLPIGGKMKIAVENGEILLVNVQGSFYAVDNKCTHMGGSLHEGKLEGFSIVCPKHGTAFDLRTGSVSASGKIAFFKVNPKSLQTYPVEIEGTNVVVEFE